MIGQRVGNFEVIEELGRGGMGVVYRAHDPRLGRDVALKVMHAERLGDERRRKRFLREARTVSALAHPGIVTLFDIVEHPAGPESGTIDVLVMEWIRGRPLRRILAAGAMPWRRAATLAAGLAEAMAEAHRIGIVHRDLKPENIMVTSDDRVKILDFGLAKLDPLITPEHGSAELETVISSLSAGHRIGAGTVAYMPPEQALGETIDLRTDLYSFGVILYEMLTGERPFHGDSAMKVVKAALYEAPPPLEVPEGEEPLPTELVHLVGQCLEKRPEKRPEDFGRVAGRLARLLEWPEPEELPSAVSDSADAADEDDRAEPSETETSAHRANETYAALSRIWGRPGRRATLAILLAIAAIVLVSFVGLRWQEAPEGASEAAAGEAAAGEAAAGETSDSSAIEPQASAYELYKRARSLLERYDLPGNIDQAIELLDLALDRDGDSAAVHAAMSEAHCHRYQVENSDPLFLDRAESHARRAVEIDSHLALAQLAIARVATIRGETELALEALEWAALLDPLDSRAALLRGVALEGSGELAKAEEAFRQAIELAPEAREGHDYLGSLLFRLGRYQEAEAAFARAVELTPDSYISRRNLAGALQMLGRNAEAAAELQRSLAIRPNWSTYTNLGTLQYFMGLYAEAIDAFEKAIDLGANDYRSWANLADAYRVSAAHRSEAPDTYRRAIQLAEEKLAEQERIDGPDSTPDATLISRIALYSVKSGDRSKALLLARGLNIEAADTALLGRLIQVYELAGERRQALDLLARALDAGYPVEAIRSEPELVELRRDPDYHRLLAERSPSR